MSQIYKIDTDQHQQRRRDDSRIRLSVARNIPEWDEEWGGDCPWRKSDPEFEELRRKAGIVDEDVWGKDKPWIDKAMPWILVWGGLALLIGLYGILHWFLFTVVPGVM